MHSIDLELNSLVLFGGGEGREKREEEKKKKNPPLLCGPELAVRPQGDSNEARHMDNIETKLQLLLLSSHALFSFFSFFDTIPAEKFSDLRGQGSSVASVMPFPMQGFQSACEKGGEKPT